MLTDLLTGSFVVSFSKVEGPKIRVLHTEKRIKDFSLGNPYTQLFDISIIEAIGLSKKQP